MFDSQSQPSGGQSPDDITSGKAEAGQGPGGLQILPEGLDAMAPGAALGAVLETVDLSRLTGYDTVLVLRAQQRQVSHYQARLHEAMIEVAHAVSATTAERSSRPNRFAADEIAAALACCRRKAESKLATALWLRGRRPAARFLQSDYVGCGQARADTSRADFRPVRPRGYVEDHS